MRLLQRSTDQCASKFSSCCCGRNRKAGFRYFLSLTTWRLYARSATEYSSCTWAGSLSWPTAPLCSRERGIHTQRRCLKRCPFLIRPRPAAMRHSPAKCRRSSHRHRAAHFIRDARTQKRSARQHAHPFANSMASQLRVILPRTFSVRPRYRSSAQQPVISFPHGSLRCRFTSVKKHPVDERLLELVGGMLVVGNKAQRSEPFRQLTCQSRALLTSVEKCAVCGRLLDAGHWERHWCAIDGQQALLERRLYRVVIALSS